VDGQSQSDARAVRIAALKASIEELRRERRRVLGIVTTARLDPQSQVTMDDRLRAIQEKLRLELSRLSDLEKTLD
jgi:hypothetical protein